MSDYYDRGLRLFQSGRSDEALAVLDEGISKDRRDPSLWHIKALVLAGMHRYQEALRATDTALGYAESWDDVWQTRARILIALNRPQEAQVAEETAREIMRLKRQGLIPRCQGCSVKLPKYWRPNPFFTREQIGFCSTECEMKFTGRVQAGDVLRGVRPGDPNAAIEKLTDR